MPDPATPAAPSLTEAKSIVDTILNLDEFLSGEVRRYEDTFTFSTKPDLQAQLEQLIDDLNTLELQAPAPKAQKPDADESLAEPAPEQVAVDEQIVAKIREIHAFETEFADSFRAIKLRQEDPEDFVEFRRKWKDEFAKAFLDQDTSMHDELVAATAVEPAVPVEKMAALKKHMGLPTFERLFAKAWEVNSHQGVSVPKSLLSSDDLKRAGLETS